MKALKSFKNSTDLKIILMAVAYYLAARIGLFLAFENTNTSPVWPPSGIAFALILLLGYRSWPGITIGALIANILVFFGNDIAPASNMIIASTLIAAGNTLEALFGYFLMHKFIKNTNPFAKTSDTYKFISIAVLTSIVSALLGPFGLWISNIIYTELYTQISIVWWIGDLVGILLFTPFILSWKTPFKFKVTREKVLEVFLYLLLFGTFVTLLQVSVISAAIEKSIPFLVMPFLIWLGYRFNLQTAMSAALLTSVTAIYFTIQNIGPFELNTTNNSLILLQVFVGVISITLIILSATVSERNVAQKEIIDFNENLEMKVQARTKALNEEIKTRKQAEENIIKSNQELRKTNEELDSFVYSVSHDLRAPISSVMGLINLALKEKDTKMVNQYLDMMNKSIVQQDIFIKEILDLSRNARLELNKDKISFEEIVNDIFNQLQYSSDTEKVEKKIEIKQTKEFYSDKRRIKVVFNNLISNALRYNNAKNPFVSVQTVVNNGSANIVISDNGRGIGQEHMDNIFKMFYRATDKGAGSGLGLYIVQETMTKLGGNVEINSQLNKGTQVSLKIPAM